MRPVAGRSSGGLIGNDAGHGIGVAERIEAPHQAPSESSAALAQNAEAGLTRNVEAALARNVEAGLARIVKSGLRGI